jgi:hypothetical protein
MSYAIFALDDLVHQNVLVGDISGVIQGIYRAYYCACLAPLCLLGTIVRSKLSQ